MAEAQTDLAGYDGPEFRSLVSDLSKTSIYEMKRARSVVKKLESQGLPMSGADQRGLEKDVKSLQSSRISFYKVFDKMDKTGKVKAKDIETAYDDYCYALAMLTAHSDRWYAALSSGVIKKFLSVLVLLAQMQARVKAHGKKLQAEVAELEKLLSKAEKAKWKSYIKTGLSFAWDAAKILSPQLRGISKISDLAIGGLIDVGSNILVGKPSDFVGSSLGLVVSGAELEYQQRGLEGASKALGKAGKAMKLDGMAGAKKDIGDARKLVSLIEKRIARVQKQIKTNAAVLKDARALRIKAEKDMNNLIRKLQSDAAKADKAREQYQHFKALRAKLAK